MSTVSSTEFAAFRAEVDERFQNIFDQMALLSNKVDAVEASTAVADFPDEQAQIREKVSTAFQEEIAQLVDDINKLKADVTAIQLIVE